MASPAQIIKGVELAQAIVEAKQLKRKNALHFYKPYDRQKIFHYQSSDYAQRCMGAGNQLGKTLCGSMEAAYHTTGKYPDWWTGKRFQNPTVGWVCGVTPSSS